MNEKIKSFMENPRRGLLILSWPMIVSMVFGTLLSFVDFFFVGGLGPNALAAVQFSFPIFFFIIALGSGISIGTTALMAKRLGEKNKKWAEETALHSLLLSFLVSLVFTVLVLVIDPIAHGLGGGPEVAHLAADYMSVLFAGSLVFFLNFSMMAILQAQGDTKLIMKLSVAYTLINIVLNPIFIYSLGLGIRGSSLANVLSEGLALLYFFWHILARKKTFLQISLRDFIYTPQIMKNILKVGIPAALAEIGLSIAVLGINFVLVGFGDLAVSAYGVGFRIDSLAILPVLGLGSGVITMVGYFRGAKDYKGARRVYRMAIKLVLVFTIVTGAAIFLLSWSLPHLFTKDAAVIGMASDYLRIIAFNYPLIGVAIVLSSAFQGMGRGVPSLVITMARAILIALPVAYYLAYHTSLGVIGAWVGILLSGVFSAAAAFAWIEFYFRRLCGNC
jgi:putative MATE family efflux protein